MTTNTRTVKTTWELWSYDVWGNEDDGYEVNDRSCFDRAYELELNVEVNNPGTPHEFLSAYPTDEQIVEAFFTKPIAIELDGDDLMIYINGEDGYPWGEMNCTSHKSLSPIEE
jgi:hypothetical protein